jgi:prolyl-tRNA synthetase
MSDGKNFSKRDLPKKSESISDWYTRVILLAELADYGPAKGTMIHRPYGYAIWELVQQEMDRRIKDRGVVNGYFPLFIPESLLKKEQAHVEGFSPELAVVTIGGGEELKEKLVVRPTSETIMYEAYARWIQSWRDLPMQINQWNNVVRWEKRTYLYLRTTEFLWQEGHTAHATHEEAWDTVLWGINMYESIYRDLFALPGYLGRKSESEKFAGGDATLTYEALMPGGKALQGCTSHDLGQNFAKAFEVMFQNKEGVREHVWQTSWGFTTRSLGALILAHGDDNGLRLPPRLAPIQVVVIPLKDVPEAAVKEMVETLKTAHVRVHVDTADHESLGSRINTWELKGVPLRMEIGAKELAEKSVTIVRRDTGEKLKVQGNDVVNEVPRLLDAIQNDLLEEATKYLESHTHSVATYDEFKKVLEEDRGFLYAFWCEDDACEAAIKEETKATVRCLPLDAKEEKGECVRCGKPATHRWYFAQAY